MSSSTKAAVTIISVVGAMMLLCGGGAGVVFYMQKNGGLHLPGISLSSKNIAINMQDEATVSKRHYVDHQMGVRVRLPIGNENAQSSTLGVPGVERGFSAPGMGRSFAVLSANRGATDFETWVRINRAGISNDHSVTSMVIEDEGHTLVGGAAAYELMLRARVNGIDIKQKQVYVDGPASHVFLIIATSPDTAWEPNLPAFDSAISTFEIGQFADDAPEPNPGRGIARGGIQMQPPIEPPQQLRPLHTNFNSIDEALTTIQTGQDTEKRAALSYIERMPPDPAIHDKIVAAMIPLMANIATRDGAGNVIKNWATKDDAPVLRTELERITGSDTTARNIDGLNQRKVLINLLGKFADADSAKVLAANLRNSLARGDAASALTAIGADAEDAVLPLLIDTDSPTVREAASLLGKIGTQKSISPLQHAAVSKIPGIAAPANDAVKLIALRNNLKPDQYQFNLINHYTIEAPVGFTADTIDTPNTRQWSRTATGRVIHSVMTVTVKLVPADYKLNIPPNSTATVEAGTITFHQISSTGNNAQKTVRFAALDGECLLELTATMDAQDTSAGTNMTNAAKKIRAKMSF
ncbi:MAG TPA: HEAT repeat domain-containing protein [Phycisphaerae bacterium]|jgi:hypothetical protein